MLDSYSQTKNSIRHPNESTFVAKQDGNRYFAVRLMNKAELTKHLETHKPPVQIHKFGNDEFVIEYYKED